MKRILGLLLLLVLLGMGTSSLISIGRELSALDPHRIQESLSLGQEERIARGLARCERQLGEPEGREYQLYSVLRERTETHANVFILTPEARHGVAVQAHMRVLLRPRAIWILDRLPKGWQHKAGQLEGPVYIVQEQGPTLTSLARHCDLIHEARVVRLWRYSRESR